MKRNKLLLLLALLMTAATGAWAQTVVTIGNGTDTSPFVPYNSSFNNSLEEQIYLASEIGQSGIITAISFNSADDETYNETINVYMKNVTRSSFSSTTDYEPLAASDIVFSGSVTFGKGWKTVTLDTPFEYDNTKNLLICFYKKGSTSYSIYNTYTTQAENRTIAFYHDTNVPDPYNLGSYPKFIKLSATRANIKITIEAGGGGSGSEEASTYTVSMKDDVKDADKWTVKVGEGQAQALPIGGLKGDGSETVTLQYNGRLKVKGVKAKVKMPEVEGALKGQFAIDGSGKSIVFAKGNLQATWDGTSWTWAFAEHQWDVIGGRWSDASVPQTGNNLINGNGTMSAAGTMDLFSWVGASSTLTGLAQYGITNSNNDDDFGTVAGETLKTDWGTLAISNGGNAANSGWRTLTKAEWKYLMEERSGARYAKATVNGVAGVILLPDGWSAASLTKTNDQYADYTANTITADAWVNDYEANGAVFLPMGGFRATSGESGTVNVVNFNSPADYWSTNSDEYRTNHSNGMFCYSTDLTTAESDFRKYGKSVRLVREVK